MIKALRVSKTSMKSWVLHGPLDQALKTSIQADSVKVCPLTVPIGENGAQLELEMWIDAAEESDHRPNPPATLILAVDNARKKGTPLDTTTLTDDDGEVLIQSLHIDPSEISVVHGTAILTGAGATSIPECHTECLMQALIEAP